MIYWGLPYCYTSLAVVLLQLKEEKFFSHLFQHAHPSSTRNSNTNYSFVYSLHKCWNNLANVKDTMLHNINQIPSARVLLHISQSEHTVHTPALLLCYHWYRAPHHFRSVLFWTLLLFQSISKSAIKRLDIPLDITFHLEDFSPSLMTVGNKWSWASAVLVAKRERERQREGRNLIISLPWPSKP